MIGVRAILKPVVLTISLQSNDATLFMTTTVKMFSVSEITFAIKGQLEAAYPIVQVKGEISNFKQQSSGHLYFTLKDASAQLSAALFRGNVHTLKRLPKEGDKVVAEGQISVYPPRGGYQLIVRSLQFVGVGELLMQFHELKEKLKQRGLFDPAHKKKLPPFPKKIGVITSPTGAVIRDIVHVLTRRFAGFHLLLNPVKVQGEGAAQEIAKAIDEMNRLSACDLLIVGRGGGSLEDLWAFNEECVAEAIFRSRIPVISAVGHETDVTLADYVADVRAPTPSAAAEIAVAEKAQLIEDLKLKRKRVGQTLASVIERRRLRLQGLAKHPLFTKSSTLLAPFAQRLDEIQTTLNTLTEAKLAKLKLRLHALQRQAQALNPKQQVKVGREKIESSARHLRHAGLQCIKKRRERLLFIQTHLQAVDPKNVLKKGYCVLFSEKQDSAILSAFGLSAGQRVTLVMHDGVLKSTVNEVKTHAR